jgi:hypothetical protein
MMRTPLLILSLLSSTLAIGQTLKADTAFFADARQNVVALYTKTMASQSHLYNGHAYIEYQRQEDEHPYFIDELVDGTIVYDGEHFDGVPLLYDLSKDRLITEHPFGRNKIQLVTEKINRFTITDHLFVQLNEEKIAKGFYELSYNGTSKVYIRRQKNIQNRNSGNIIERYFIDKISFYIKKNDSFFLVKSKKSVLNAFSDKKAELKKFIRDTHLSFKSDRVKSIGRLAEYYDQLTTPHEG